MKPLLRSVLPIAALIGLTAGSSVAAEASPATFASADAGVRAIVAAARADDQAKLIAILGPGSENLISSGDPIQDRNARQRIVAAAAQRTRLETLPSGAIIAHLGSDDWPLPIPLVKDGTQWRFDTKAAQDEVLNRRIGRNELSAVDVCLVYVAAQREHARIERDYARKLRSDAGKRDGLYWEDPTGEHPSPIGPLLAGASAEGYATDNTTDGPRPYHGYFYRILTEQGPHGPGGAKSYLKDGKMVGGFALIAYPAEHGSSGIMTFIVGPQGVVYQKDLGAATAEVGKSTVAYDPDESWSPVRGD